MHAYGPGPQHPAKTVAEGRLFAVNSILYRDPVYLLRRGVAMRSLEGEIVER